MSTPRCIRLAIRACRPVKISNPAARCPRRSLATTQSFREDGKLDIKAGFPEVPKSTEESHPRPVRDDTPGDHPEKTSLFDNAHLGVRIEVMQGPVGGKLAAAGSVSDKTSPLASTTAATKEGRLLVLSGFPQRPKTAQIRDLFAEFDVELIRNMNSHTIVQMKTAKDAQRAVSALSGHRLPAFNPDGMGSKWVRARAEEKEDEENLDLIASQTTDPTNSQPRLPRNVIAAYHKPLRVAPKLGVRVASLQLRSYSIRSLEFMSDFALRAAFFLGLAASGPVPLPKKIERWTMPRSNFVHKKSQENFERITRRRAIQIHDGHKDVVQIWLAYLRKHQFYGVGMKADVWEFEVMDVAGSMDLQFAEVEKELDEKLSMFGWNKQVAGDRSLVEGLRNMGPGQQTGVSMQHIREGSRSESRI